MRYPYENLTNGLGSDNRTKMQKNFDDIEEDMKELVQKDSANAEVAKVYTDAEVAALKQEKDADIAEVEATASGAVTTANDADEKATTALNNSSPEVVGELSGQINAKSSAENLLYPHDTGWGGTAVFDGSLFSITAVDSTSFASKNIVLPVHAQQEGKIAVGLKIIGSLPAGTRFWYRFTEQSGATIPPDYHYFESDFTGDGLYVRQNITIPAGAVRLLFCVDMRGCAPGAALNYLPPFVVPAAYVGDVYTDKVLGTVAKNDVYVSGNARSITSDDSRSNLVYFTDGSLDLAKVAAHTGDPHFYALTYDPAYAYVSEVGIRVNGSLNNTGNGYLFYRMKAVEKLAPGSTMSLMLKMLKEMPGLKLELKFYSSFSTSTLISTQNLLSDENGWYGLSDVLIPSTAVMIEIRIDFRNAVAVNDYVVFTDLIVVASSAVNALVLSKEGQKKLERNIDAVYFAFGSQLFPEPVIKSVNWINYNTGGPNIVSFEAVNEVGHVVITPAAVTSLQATGYDLLLPDDIQPGEAVQLFLNIPIVLKTDANFAFVTFPLNSAGAEITGNRGTYSITAVRTISHTMTLPAGAKKIRLRFDVTTASADVNQQIKIDRISVVRTNTLKDPTEIMDRRAAEMNRAIESYLAGSTSFTPGDVYKYVGLNGSDNNSGNTPAAALATVNKAVQLGATVILIERGTYYGQTISAQNKKKIMLLPLSHAAWDQNKPDTQKVVFNGADPLPDMWEAFEGVFRQPYSGNTLFHNVFVAQMTPPISDGSRPSYNAALWEGNDRHSDEKLKPVLTLDECKAEEGTFYYDGSYVYVYPFGGVAAGKVYHATRLGIGINVDGTQQVVMQDIVADFYQANPMRLKGVQHLYTQNCEAGHSSTTDGFNLNMSNGMLSHCKAYKNRNDGFNVHGYGDTIIFHCDGFHNYDDGISHHDGCNGVIIGGNWYGNYKGGIIPTYGSVVHVHGATCWNNRHGINFTGASYSMRREVNIRDCKLYENEHGILVSQSYHVDVDNCLIEGNDHGVTVQSDGSAGISRSTVVDSVLDGVNHEGTGIVHLSESKLSDNVRGVVVSGGGAVSLKRSHLLHHSVSGINLIAGTVSVEKRNNLYGNALDYEGVEIPQAERDKNVSIPAI